MAEHLCRRGGHLELRPRLLELREQVFLEERLVGAGGGGALEGLGGAKKGGFGGLGFGGSGVVLETHVLEELADPLDLLRLGLAPRRHHLPQLEHEGVQFRGEEVDPGLGLQAVLVQQSRKLHLNHPNRLNAHFSPSQHHHPEPRAPAAKGGATQAGKAGLGQRPAQGHTASQLLAGPPYKNSRTGGRQQAPNLLAQQTLPLRQPNLNLPSRPPLNVDPAQLVQIRAIPGPGPLQQQSACFDADPEGA